MTDTQTNALSAVTTKAGVRKSCPEANPAKETRKITAVTTEYAAQP